jgi:hypothetical protein
VGACDTPDYAWGVHVEGSYAYVADRVSGLQVIAEFSPFTDIQYIDSSTLTATVPAGYRPGTYNLHVTNPDGGHAVLPNAFTVYLPGDLDGDNDIDNDDFQIFLTAYGSCKGDANFIPEADLDSDECITINDYRIMRNLV